MDFSSARASGTNEEQFSSILQGLRDRRQCTSDGCARVPHVHVKDVPSCAMLLSSVEYSITKRAVVGNNLPGLLSCSSAARHILMLVKAGVTTLSFPLSMYYPHPHVPCKQVSSNVKMIVSVVFKAWFKNETNISMTSQDMQETRDGIAMLYEGHLLYNCSLAMCRQGVLEKPIEQPPILASHKIAHCFCIIVDFEKGRVLVVDPLRVGESVYSFRDGQAPTFSLKTLADLFLQPRFPKHPSGSNRGWLTSCRMMYGYHSSDTKCVDHALRLCAGLVNEPGDFEKRWTEASINNNFTLQDSKTKRDW